MKTKRRIELFRALLSFALNNLDDINEAFEDLKATEAEIALLGFEFQQGAKIIVLSNGAYLGIQEQDNALDIAQVDEDGTDTFIATISGDGVHVYPNSTEAPEILTRDLRCSILLCNLDV